MEHHAYLLEGTIDDLRIHAQGTPHVFEYTYQVMGVGDARMLSERATRRATNGIQVFLISAAGMTAEAQNALLKTLEEPTSHSIFYFALPRRSMLLPTLLSRMQFIESDSDLGRDHLERAEHFLKASIKGRLDMVGELVPKKSGEEKDMHAILGFLNALELAVTSHSSAGERKDAMEAIYRAKRYANDRGASLKTLLEQAALLIPAH